MKYDVIKAKAAFLFSSMVDQELARPGLPNDASAPADLSFKALASDLGMAEPIRRDTLQQVKVRGVAIINHWDVRNVAKLISLFPDSAPSIQGKPLHAYMADNAESDWMVEKCS